MSKEFVIKHLDKINIYNLWNNNNILFSLGLFKDGVKFYDKEGMRSKERNYYECHLAACLEDYDDDYKEIFKRELEDQLYAELAIEDIRYLEE
jgi:hypothetical protein